MLNALSEPILSLEAIEQDPINRSLLKALKEFADTLALYGYGVQVSSPSALAKLPLIPQAKKEQLIDYYENWRRWIAPVANQSVYEIDIKREQEFAQHALDHYKLSVHESFWKTLQKDQVVEIYGENMIQLYRSISFFKFSGYSLLDISVHEWYALWERPKRIIEFMNTYVENVMTNYVELQKFECPRHILRETLNTGLTDLFTPRVVIVDFKNIASLKDGKTTSPKGLAVTSTAQLVAEGHGALNIDFV